MLPGAESFDLRTQDVRINLNNHCPVFGSDLHPMGTAAEGGNVDLLDHLFNSSDKRLARTLLLLARYGEPEASHRALPKVSQAVLAEMVGTTRSRVNFFMNKFRKLGFIDYNGTLKINNSLLRVVLRD